MGDQEAGYFAIIPAEVRYDDDLIPNAKLLYGEITALCKKEGYCWATNKHFAELYKTSEKTITRWINNLEEKGYIATTVQTFRYNDGTVKKIRYIFLDKNKLDHMDKNVLNHMDKNVLNQPDENVPYNSKISNSKINNSKEDTRHKYGEYKNVLLTNEQLEQLKAEFPQDWQKRIEKVSAYSASTGKTYKNYLATIRNWAKRDYEKKKQDDDRFYKSEVEEDDLPF